MRYDSNLRCIKWSLKASNSCSGQILSLSQVEAGVNGLVFIIICYASRLCPLCQGVGFCFGPDVTRRWCTLNGVSGIIRSHEVRQGMLSSNATIVILKSGRLAEGYEIEHDGLCTTVNKLYSRHIYHSLTHHLRFSRRQIMWIKATIREHSCVILWAVCQFLKLTLRRTDSN